MFELSQFLEMVDSNAKIALQLELANKDEQLENALKEITLSTARNAEQAAMIKCLNEQIVDAHRMITCLIIQDSRIKEENHSEGFLQGVKLCRRKIILTSSSQKVIKNL